MFFSIYNSSVIFSKLFSNENNFYFSFFVLFSKHFTEIIVRRDAFEYVAMDQQIKMPKKKFILLLNVHLHDNLSHLTNVSVIYA